MSIHFDSVPALGGQTDGTELVKQYRSLRASRSACNADAL